MEKRFQVFISSTYQDLQNARQEVSQALLRADCFPAGMELFPAADEEQFEFIKTIIDQSDYYILISAGRYGSIHPETGLSYTEMEYDYAIEIGKPIIRLLHRDPFNELKGEFIENSDRGRAALEKFRAKLTEQKLVRFWETAKELGLEAFVALADIKKRTNAVGWVRSDTVIDGSAALELAELREKVKIFEATKDSAFIFDDPVATKIRNFVETEHMTTYGQSYDRFAKRNIYLRMLENIKYDRNVFYDLEGEDEDLARDLFGLLMAVGSLVSSSDGIELTDRTYADFGFATLKH
ncbi:hypothetical protein NBRC116601_01910 [Cognatishimia sp. WU-CL00825]|uniref:DUF4062 domain-containing protein n=1 Tax=Cognatishimia sp. WU-CL00825 TaxID=3127658 RepID=UPI00310AAD97